MTDQGVEVPDSCDNSKHVEYHSALQLDQFFNCVTVYMQIGMVLISCFKGK